MSAKVVSMEVHPQMETLNMVFEGKIFIPDGYATQWPNGQRGKLPRLDGNAFIPFPQIKGGLRRAAVRSIVQASGRKLKDVTSYYFNVVGGVKGSKTEEDKKRDTSLTAFQDVRKRNPVTGLFGSGDVLGSFYAGRIFGQHGIAENPEYGIFGGVRTDDSRRDPDGMALMISGESLDADVAEMHRINTERTRIKQEIKKLKGGFRNKEMSAAQKKTLNDDIKTLEKDLKDLDGGGNPVSMPLEGFEYVRARHFQTGMALSAVTLVELGLLIAAMETQMQTDPYLGAHRSSGFGQFSAQWTCPEGRIDLVPFEGARVEGEKLHLAKSLFLQAVPTFDMDKC